MDPEMSGLGSLLAKDEDIKIIFIQNNLLVLSPHEFYQIIKAIFKYQTRDYPVKAFFISVFFDLLISILSFLKGRKFEVSFINFH